MNVRRPMRRDADRVPEDLIAGVREMTESAADSEIRAALSGLSRKEEVQLRELLRDPPPGRFGPFAWADLARGISPQVAAARELSGYYELQAERDTLAAMVREEKGAQISRPVPSAAARWPEPAAPRKRSAPRGSAAREERAARTQHLLGLFAYHRDAPLVERALQTSLEALNEELDALGIRRQAYRITRGTDAQMPIASPVAAPAGPPVRRRTHAPGPPPSPAPPQDEGEPAMLRAVLSEVGPRRPLLAERLGVEGRALLARFRAAGLERELALRERDLIRALYSRHRGAEAKVAAELGIAPEALRDVVVERGLARELQSMRDRFRREALRSRWPRERIEQVLHRREELQDLGLLERLEKEVTVRAGVIWRSLSGKRDALDLLAKKLRLSREDAVRLQKLLDLR